MLSPAYRYGIKYDYEWVLGPIGLIKRVYGDFCETKLTDPFLTEILEFEGKFKYFTQLWTSYLTPMVVIESI